MSLLIQAVLESDERSDLRQFASELQIQEHRYLLRNEILSAFATYCDKYEKSEQFRRTSHLQKLVFYTQEIILENNSLCLIIRPKIASQEIYRLDHYELTYERMTVQELLDLRDRFVGRYHPQEGDVLEIDFQPFYDYSPTIRDSKNIGRGVQFLNRYLSSKLFQDPRQWVTDLFNFLRLHSYEGLQLLINERIQTHQQLSDAVKQAIIFVSNLPTDKPITSSALICRGWALNPVGEIRRGGYRKPWKFSMN